MGQLNGKVAVITGAETGLGAAVATLFAGEGAAVVLNGQRAPTLEHVAFDIRDTGGRAFPSQVT